MARGFYRIPDHPASRRATQPTNDMKDRKSRPLIYAMNRFAITIAIAAIVGLLIGGVVEAFTISPEVGIRSFAAAALPPIVITYSSFFARPVKPSEQVLEVNLYAIALAWVLVLLMVVDFVTSRFNHAIPLGEFLISLTLSGLIYFIRRLSLRSRLSCAYGILSGFLVHILIFGLPSN
jgi:hypothetical protein